MRPSAPGRAYRAVTKDANPPHRVLGSFVGSFFAFSTDCAFFIPDFAFVQKKRPLVLTDDEDNSTQTQRNAPRRYDALGDSPGAQGPSSQGPRSPSVYSHFSQSVFSQSAYGPSAYGPSQRRPGGGPGSVYGHSQYGDGSSLGGSQYPGPVPSHFGASQMSSERTSYHTSNGGGSSGVGGGSGKIVAGGRGETMFGSRPQVRCFVLCLMFYFHCGCGYR